MPTLSASPQFSAKTASPKDDALSPRARKKAAIVINERSSEFWSPLQAMFNQSIRDRIELHFELLPDVITYEQLISEEWDKSTLSVLFGTSGFPALSAEQLRKFPSLEIIFFAAGSIKSWGLPFLSSGIRVCTAKRANAHVVADFCQAQILLAAKNYFLQARDYQRSTRKPIDRIPVSGYANTKIALIGCGLIALKVIQHLRRFAFDIYVVDPYLKAAEAKKLDVTLCTLDKAFRTCKIVSNHLPNLTELGGILRYEYFAEMPPGGTFINTGRGTQVIEDDLIRALSDRPDLTALLDVTEPEPPAPDSLLFSLPNVILTPHIAGCIDHELSFLVDEIVTSSEAWSRGVELTNLESLDRFHISA